MAVSLWERGERVPSDAMKVAIAAYYKKSAMENCKGGIIYDSVFVEKKKEEESEGDIV